MKNNRKKYGMDYSIDFRKVRSEDIERLQSFDCGNPSINSFVKHECLDTHKSVTYLFIDEDTENIIGFCSICCSGILLKDGKNKVITYSNLPAVEIDFFAVDETYRNIPLEKNSKKHETLSRALFSFLIKYIESITNRFIGATYISLYSVPQAISFYKRCGFSEFEPYMQRDKKRYIEQCTPMFLTL